MMQYRSIGQRDDGGAEKHEGDEMDAMRKDRESVNLEALEENETHTCKHKHRHSHERTSVPTHTS